MNLTTLTISGLAVSLFAVAIAVRATQKQAADREGWRRLPPASPPAEAGDEQLPVEEVVLRERLRDLDRTCERAVQRDDRAKREADEALDDMRRARQRLAKSPARDDDLERSHWQQSYRSASLRRAGALHQRKGALRAIDRVRGALQDIAANEKPRVP